jgi:hypothetical protein
VHRCTERCLLARSSPDDDLVLRLWNVLPDALPAWSYNAQSSYCLWLHPGTAWPCLRISLSILARVKGNGRGEHSSQSQGFERKDWLGKRQRSQRGHCRLSPNRLTLSTVLTRKVPIKCPRQLLRVTLRYDRRRHLSTQINAPYSSSAIQYGRDVGLLKPEAQDCRQQGPSRRLPRRAYAASPPAPSSFALAILTCERLGSCMSARNCQVRSHPAKAVGCRVPQI